MLLTCMARIPERDNYTERQAKSTDGSDLGRDNGSLLGRRSVLKLAGAGIAALATGVGTTSAASYDTITVPAGSEKTFRLSDGETFENKLIDVTASNTRVSIIATGRNWTIRNVGIKGVHDQTGGHAVLGLKAAGGTDCLVENIWMGDGSATYDGAGSSETAAWVSPKSTGTITFRNCNIQNWKDNGIYASAPGRDGNGPVIIENCYAANNNHADYRIGSVGSAVRDSVVVHDKDGSDSRGVWCWYNDGLTVDNCDIDMNSYGASIHAGPYAPGEVDVYDTQYDGRLVEDGQGDGVINMRSGNGTNPQTSIPDGVPRTAEEAASGNVGSSESSSLANALRIDTASGAPLVTYEFTATGPIQMEAEAESPDSASENSDGTWTASGIVGDGYADTWSFDGHLTDFTYDNPVSLYVNGEAVDPDTVGRTYLEIGTPTSGEWLHYELTTTGEIVFGDQIESHDSITKNDDGTWTATGRLRDGYLDDYYFGGEIVTFGYDRPASVWLDGDSVDPRTLGGPRTLRIDTPPSGDLVRYSFKTSGELRRGAEAESPDASSQNADGTWTGTGVVGDGYADTWEFRGYLMNFEHDNTVSLSIDGDAVDPNAL